MERLVRVTRRVVLSSEGGTGSGMSAKAMTAQTQLLDVAKRVVMFYGGLGERAAADLSRVVADVGRIYQPPVTRRVVLSSEGRKGSSMSDGDAEAAEDRKVACPIGQCGLIGTFRPEVPESWDDELRRAHMKEAHPSRTRDTPGGA